MTVLFTQFCDSLYFLVMYIKVIQEVWIHMFILFIQIVLCKDMYVRKRYKQELTEIGFELLPF
jgi:hypothetical protein